MGFIMLIGFFATVFSIIYLIYHFLKRMKDKERRISKKIFYPSLIGGVLLFSIGATYLDTGAQAKLAEALEQNQILTTDMAELKAENEELRTQLTAKSGVRPPLS